MLFYVCLLLGIYLLYLQRGEPHRNGGHAYKYKVSRVGYGIKRIADDEQKAPLHLFGYDVVKQHRTYYEADKGDRIKQHNFSLLVLEAADKLTQSLCRVEILGDYLLRRYSNVEAVVYLGYKSDYIQRIEYPVIDEVLLFVVIYVGMKLRQYFK